MSKLDQILDASAALAQTCIDILNQQNADSYKAVVVPKLEVLSFNPKISSPNDTQLVVFYHQSMPILKFAHNLKYVCESMVYPHNEVAMHVDRSPTFILKLEHKLAKRAAQVTTYLSQLEQNIQIIINAYCEHLVDHSAHISIDVHYLELIYHCMQYDFKFIPYGVAILNQLFAIDLISDVYQTDIRRLSNEMKHKYLDIPNDKSDPTEAGSYMLQTYNLVPTLPNMSLLQIFKRIFGITINSITISNLDKVLQATSKSQGKSVSFVIIAKHNNDFYYDLDNLFDRNKLSKITNKGGISAEYIDAYQILQSILIKKKVTSQVTTYNFSAENRDTYVLWTNDNSQFKLREQPVESTIIHKLLTNQSSSVITQYNKQFELKLLDIIQNDSPVSYKQVKYLSFDTDTEEAIYIDLICSKLIKRITSIKNIAATKDLSDQFTKIFQDEFNGFKPFHKKGSIPVHALLVYNNAAIRIANRIEKELIIWSINGQPIDQIASIIKTIVASNDNIYSKFISSYYLAISGLES
jgi:hypothetical protein